MYSPAGFRSPAVRRRRGLGDASSDYSSIAASLTPGSTMYQFFTGCAANPNAPACAAEAAQNLATPYLTAPQEAAVRTAQAAGANPPTFAATVGAPPGTQLPAAPSPPVNTAAPQISAQPVVLVQPAGAPSPTGNGQQTPAPGLLSTTLLGIPLWIWGIGAVGAYFVFGQEGGHFGR